MVRAITITSGGGTIGIGTDIRLGRAMRGTGLPPVQAQFFEGAGAGASWRGSRILARVQDIPFKVYGVDRATVWANYEKLAKVFAPEAGEVKMKIVLDGEEWYNTFVRTGGGDWDWGTDTDGTSFIKTLITVKAGDPYFTRSNATSQQIALGGLGRGLIKETSLSKLQLSTNNSLGSVLLINPGSVGVGARWVLKGPFTGFTFTSPSGKILDWDSIEDIYDAPLINEWIEVDFELGTAVDDQGRNRFGGFVGVPDFWPVPPGTNTAQIELADATSDSSVTIYFNPKRWVMF